MWFCDGWLRATMIGVSVMVLLQVGFWIALNISEKSFYKIRIFTAVLVPLLLIVMAQIVVTDKEQIRENVYTIAHEIEQGNLRNVQAMISPSAKPMRRSVAGYMSRYQIKKLTIKSNLNVELKSGTDPPLASATFNIVVSATGFSNLPIYIEVKLRKEQGKWLFYDHTNPKVGLLK